MTITFPQKMFALVGGFMMLTAIFDFWSASTSAEHVLSLTIGFLSLIILVRELTPRNI